MIPYILAQDSVQGEYNTEFDCPDGNRSRRGFVLATSIGIGMLPFTLFGILVLIRFLGTMPFLTCLRLIAKRAQCGPHGSDQFPGLDHADDVRDGRPDGNRDAVCPSRGIGNADRRLSTLTARRHDKVAVVEERLP